MPQGDGTGGDQATRRKLAFWIIALSIVGIAIIAGLAIGLATSKDRPETTRLVFTSMLPLLGTWVGTVLAFYFAHDSLQSATESTLRLSQRLEPRTPVQQVMIQKSQIDAYQLKDQEAADDVRLSDLRTQMRAKNRLRIPILTESGAVQYVVHDSSIAAFAVSVGKDPGDAGQFTETIATLRGVEAFKTAIEAIGFVGPDAVLAEARATMRSVPGCNDVFVTTHGQKTDPIVGWLTNTDMAGLD